MRLTLRTLLAYRDRVLNSNDLDGMHARVQQSAMASNLIKRLESLSHRTNILAPPIEGKGLGGDANSIAEYLDDTLKGDKVPELERICLESDVQLAELAQCHSMLSAALSTAIDVPDSLRQRVIGLENESQRAAEMARRHSDAQSLTDSAAVAAERSGMESERSNESRERMRFRTDAPHVASSSPTPGDGQALGAKAKTNDRVLVKAEAVTAPMMASGGDSIRPTGLDLEGSHLAHEVPEYLRGRSRDGWLGPVAIGALLCLLGLLVWQSMGSWDSVREMLAETPKSKTNSGIEKDSEPTRPDPTSSPTSIPTENGTKSNSVNNKPPSEPARMPDPKPTQDHPSRAPTEAGSSDNSTKPSAGNGGQAAGPDRTANDSSPSGLPQVAQWLPVDATAMQSVVLVQAGALPLHRLQPSESIPTGSQLFVPSANRPKLDLLSGPTWQVCGMTHAILIKPESGRAAAPQLDLRLGRAVVAGSAAGETVTLVSPAGTVRLTLAGNASAAVEVSYQPAAHGLVTNRSAYLPVLAIVGLEGETSIELNDQTTRVPSGKKLSISAGKPNAVESSEPPQWIDASFDRPVDLLAAADLSKQLSAGISIGEVLQTFATNRRPETRALAAQTLSLLGSWEWVTQTKSSLAEVRDRSFWAALLDRTRQILAAHPDNVDALAASLKQLDPQTAEWRLKLWLGLSMEQLQADGSKAILASLEHESLIERILAIQQLQRATGKDLGYQAGEPNRAIVTQLGRDLAAGKIAYLPIPKS